VAIQEIIHRTLIGAAGLPHLLRLSAMTWFHCERTYTFLLLNIVFCSLHVVYILIILVAKGIAMSDIHPSKPKVLALWQRGVHRQYRTPEDTQIELLTDTIALNPMQSEQATAWAQRMIDTIRQAPKNSFDLSQILHQYKLTTEEGMALMCLAEAFLRIPDQATARALLKGTLSQPQWQLAKEQSLSMLAKLTLWSLRGAKLVLQDAPQEKGVLPTLQRLAQQTIEKLGEPIIYNATAQIMRQLGQQFVFAETIEEAARLSLKGSRHSFDMLGEGARTHEDAERYFRAYLHAANTLSLGTYAEAIEERPGISVKLSALHPRYSYRQEECMLPELTARLLELAKICCAGNIAMTIDAEESDRLDLSLQLLERLMQEPALASWEGLGLAVQAYQRRALAVVHTAIYLADTYRRKLNVRLVKGAYWDTEIKLAQDQGMVDYPVYTRKCYTDVSYLACAQALLAAKDTIYSQFATHNALTVSTILAMSGYQEGQILPFEFQRLHGMGEALYTHLAQTAGIPCRIYAPIGEHQILLPYLVRRLLENGSNSSFVYQLDDPGIPHDALIADPRVLAAQSATKPLPRPSELFGLERKNSDGVDLANPMTRQHFLEDLAKIGTKFWQAPPLVGGKKLAGNQLPIINPTLPDDAVGEVLLADANAAKLAFNIAATRTEEWSDAAGRAAVLNHTAELLEKRMVPLVSLLVREAGKCIPDAISEVREAVDFCRYYAAQIHADFVMPTTLSHIAGENNHLHYRRRGVFVCISPWNFPLAIFIGQVAAALAAGNSVLAKPAEATPLVAMQAVLCLYEAGVPKDVLHFLPGRSSEIGHALLQHPSLAGVAFTGSTSAAQDIAQQLSARTGPIVPFIAETGGINVMIADASCVLEQLTDDVLASSMNSAGQRCSALRLLCVQEDIAEPAIAMLIGALRQWHVGNPAALASDQGPIIRASAKHELEAYIRRMTEVGTLLYRHADIPSMGHFMAPCIIELARVQDLTEEAFGPILHVVRYRREQLDTILEAIRNSGFGLTLGIHSRIETTIQHIIHRAHVGNIYVNRNMIGAVVGMQPFGGMGLSGTGPKAGGPNYVRRFAVEQVVSTNTMASGGNAALLSSQHD
jgi:RHH-type proline utilization regulon transcriptional repressor/proline dehydrogenase/delta 1-pyrroline-5-carboxylate dehydrogenase